MNTIINRASARCGCRWLWRHESVRGQWGLTVVRLGCLAHRAARTIGAAA
jgi:hypothetical protein